MQTALQQQRDALDAQQSSTTSRSSAQADELAALKQRYSAQFAASKQQVEAAEERAQALRKQLAARDKELAALRSGQGDVLELPGESAAAREPPEGGSVRVKRGEPGSGPPPGGAPPAGGDPAAGDMTAWASQLLTSLATPPGATDGGAPPSLPSPLSLAAVPRSPPPGRGPCTEQAREHALRAGSTATLEREKEVAGAATTTLERPVAAPAPVAAPPRAATAFVASGHIKPHPDKVARGGEDAFFIVPHAFGVADGVGSWGSSGVDPGLYSKQLMSFTSRAMGQRSKSALAALTYAHDKVGAQGTSTAIVARCAPRASCHAETHCLALLACLVVRRRCTDSPDCARTLR